MLFNSPIFICIFLPIVLSIYWLLRHQYPIQWSIRFLILASLFFYGYWKPIYLLLLLGSKAVNFLLNILIQGNQGFKRKLAFISCIVFNLGLLGIFKYTDFVFSNINDVFGLSIPLPHFKLPLGISFFTFQNIAYTVSVYQGLIQDLSLERYAFFITFFPQLIAGPIVKYEHFNDQLETLDQHTQTRLQTMNVGITAFVLGLFKKTIIADSLSDNSLMFIDGSIAEKEDYLSISALEGWLACFSYGFQIYFDFSGYSDMAIGLALMFGLKLPANFNSPYKSTSIIEFWRRWHITLSDFLRDYLYIPLGGNRAGKSRQILNLMITMLLGGLWHGASWNFVIWGGIHGLLLSINHLWNQIPMFRIAHQPKGWFSVLIKELFWLMTLISIFLAWLPFRATNFASLNRVFQAMTGHGNGWFRSYIYTPLDINIQITLMVVLLLIVKFMPNTLEYLKNYHPVLDSELVLRSNNQLVWRNTWAHGIFIGGLVFLIFKHFFEAKPSEFLYFNF